MDQPAAESRAFQRVRAARVLACALLCLPVSCAPPPDPPSFVFVLIDTLRRDHVGFFGYERDTTPFIDSLAERGLGFENAVAQAPWTGASMASLWTSRYPSEVGGVVMPDASGVQWLERDGVRRLSEEWPTLAELLGGAGYRTLAVVANPYAGDDVGLLRGFESRVQKPLRDAERLTNFALATLDEALEASPDPFFLYVHYVDPHEPTTPPEPWYSRYPADDGAPHERRHSAWQFGRADDPEAPEVRRFRSHKIALYDGALRFVDEQLRRIADHLEESGRLSSTVFVIASDHGEEFWDHARFGREHHADPRGVAGIGHGHSLFGELLDVPLVLSGPGVPRARVSALVRNLDVAPTILALAGVEGAGFAPRGRDLVAAQAEPRFPELPALSESLCYGPEAKSLQRGEQKLIRYSRTHNGRSDFLFDRTSDPGEQSARPADAAGGRALGAELEEILASRQLRPGAGAELDDATREQLRAMGYGE